MTQTFTETLTIHHCGVCGIAFGMTQEKSNRCNTRNEGFYCPNGHSLHFITSKLDTANAEIERLKKSLKWEEEYGTRQREAKESAERRVAAKKGQITKLKNRAANGVCPCCNRYFENLHRHMSTQHPDFRTTEDEGNSSVESSDKTP